jgi:Protoporphyrinogen oxidase
MEPHLTLVVVNENILGQPIESNIWQMKISDQTEYLKSIAIAGCALGVPMPKKFTDWIYWKFGKRIAEDDMIPYNRKMFGKDLDLLGTYLLEKLPSVSLEKTLCSCLGKKA